MPLCATDARGSSATVTLLAVALAGHCGACMHDLDRVQVVLEVPPRSIFLRHVDDTKFCGCATGVRSTRPVPIIRSSHKDSMDCVRKRIAAWRRMDGHRATRAYPSVERRFFSAKYYINFIKYINYMSKVCCSIGCYQLL